MPGDYRNLGTRASARRKIRLAVAKTGTKVIFVKIPEVTFSFRKDHDGHWPLDLETRIQKALSKHEAVYVRFAESVDGIVVRNYHRGISRVIRKNDFPDRIARSIQITAVLKNPVAGYIPRNWKVVVSCIAYNDDMGWRRLWSANVADLGRFDLSSRAFSLLLTRSWKQLLRIREIDLSNSWPIVPERRW